MDKRKKGTIRTASSMMLFVVAMLALYFVVINRPNNEDDGIPTTERDKLLTWDLDNNYPVNPSEVVKLYGRYSMYLYNEKLSDEPLSDEEFSAMVDQMRKLFATEFADNNPRENQIENLNKETDENKKTSLRISKFTPKPESQTQYVTTDSGEEASVDASLFFTNKNGHDTADQQFLLRKEEEQWKILGFQPIASAEDGSEEGEATE